MAPIFLLFNISKKRRHRKTYIGTVLFPSVITGERYLPALITFIY